MKTLLVAVALLLLPSAVLAEECENGSVYVAEDDYTKEAFTLKTGALWSHGMHTFESRIGGKHIWSFEAEYGCSNGIPFCSMYIPTTEESFEISIDEVEASNGEKFLVFAQASQKLASAFLRVDGFDVNAEWHADRKKLEFQEVRIPNVFKFKECL